MKLVIFALIPLILSIGIIPLLPNIDAEESSIPSWIKTTAEFWINGDVSDDEFISALQFLVEQGVLTIPQSESILTTSQIVEPTKTCTRDYRPVCSVGGITYGNLCTLESSSASFSYHG